MKVSLEKNGMISWNLNLPAIVLSLLGVSIVCLEQSGILEDVAKSCTPVDNQNYGQQWNTWKILIHMLIFLLNLFMHPTDQIIEKKLFVLKPKYKILRIYMTGVIKLRQDDCETNSLLTDWAAALWWFVTNFVWSVVHNSWPECSIGWSVVWVSSSESCCWDVSAPPSSLLATSSGVPDTSALSSVLLES